MMIGIYTLTALTDSRPSRTPSLPPLLQAIMSPPWPKVFYIFTYVSLIIGIGLSLLVTGYDLVEQTLVLAQGGGKYFYIFILVGAYVATVSPDISGQTDLRDCYLG